MIWFTGLSGCGKSTLLDMLAFILQPSEVGAFRFRPEPSNEPINVATCWNKSKQNYLGKLRKNYMGYVMQTGGLVPYLTVRDNKVFLKTLNGLKQVDSRFAYFKLCRMHADCQSAYTTGDIITRERPLPAFIQLAGGIQGQGMCRDGGSLLECFRNDGRCHSSFAS